MMYLVRTIGIISLLFVCSGCAMFNRYIYVHDRYPVYDLPPKANIHIITAEEFKNLDPETKKKIIETVKNLKIESAQLRAILESYNEYAVDINNKYDELVKNNK